MRKFLLIGVAALSLASWEAKAQTDLTAYVDANGFLDVQALNCAQLAGTWQQDADALMTWYSGWYNGLAKKHFFHISRAKQLEHETILYCKANQGIRIIDAMAVIFKDERIRRGIEMRAD
jgi:HdeA/HdeB family protein